MPEATVETGLIAGSIIGVIVVAAALWWADVIRPASFRRAGLRELRGVPGSAWLMCALAMFFVQVAGSALGAAAAVDAGLVDAEQLSEGPIPAPAQGLIFGCTYGAMVATGALMMYLLRGRGGASTGIAWRWWDPLLAAGFLLMTVPLYMGASVAVEMLARAVDPGSVEAIAHDTLREILDQRGTVWFWVLTVAVVVGAPITEEIVFRLFLQSAILRWTGSAWGAIGVTAVLFGAVHAGATPWYALPVLALLGATWGLAFERTRRIGVPIMMHALFNAAQIGLGLLQPETLSGAN